MHSRSVRRNMVASKVTNRSSGAATPGGATRRRSMTRHQSSSDSDVEMERASQNAPLLDSTSGDADFSGEKLGFLASLRKHGDVWNFIVLLALYTLQGIPMGLGGSIPLILQNKGVTYTDQAVYSLVSWPFSLKLLWAPIVDAVYSPAFGRRKSWLVPVQLSAGILMICMYSFVDQLLGEGPDGTVNVHALTAIFLFLYFLMATQDIAVDGWALTMLSPANVGHASTANSVGQTLGYFIAYIIFIAFNSPDFCNTFRDIPSNVPFLTLGQFMLFWGVIFVAITLAVWIWKHEREEPVAAENVFETYTQMIQVMRLKSFQTLALVLLTCKIAFSAAESIGHLKLIEKGVPSQHIAFLGVAMVPFSIVIPLIIASRSSGPRPFSLFMAGYGPRLVLAGISVVIVQSVPSYTDNDIPYFFYGIMLFLMLCGAFANNLMFVSQMAFFARVSDPAIGGTYMTLLNTVANLGTKWPQTVNLFLMDPLTVKECTQLDGTDTETCETTFDGFYALVALGVCIGTIWYVVMGKVVNTMQEQSLENWRTSTLTKNEVNAISK